MLLVSFHDDAGGKRNVESYSDKGALTSKGVLGGTNLDDAELRGLSLAPDGALWVLNGAAKASEILRFTGSGTSYTLAGVIASYPAVNSLLHPFDLAFAAQGAQIFCYVSNQDTDVVARFALAPDRKSAKPVPPPSGLPSSGKFLTGTFVAASTCQLPGIPETTPIAQIRGGLDVTVQTLEKNKQLEEKVTHSVRGVVWSGERLYVADEPGNAIKVYDQSGNFLGQTAPIQAPVHLCVHEETYKGSRVQTLYASGSSGVFCATLPLVGKAKGIFEFPEKPLLEQPGAAGIAFSRTDLYVADRKTAKIFHYEGFSREAHEHHFKPFAVSTSPEFVLYVADATAPD
jgi:hypothetical protein